MAKAGSREKQFIDLCGKLDAKLLCGKISFEDSNKVYVSVDNSIFLNDAIILIEIDASNQAKLVSGQYTLLNLLKENPSKKYENLVKGKELIFFVIHCYGKSENRSKYNPERSKKNFKLIKESAFKGKGLKYGSTHIDDLTAKTIDSKAKLIDEIVRNII